MTSCRIPSKFLTSKVLPRMYCDYASGEGFMQCQDQKMTLSIFSDTITFFHVKPKDIWMTALTSSELT